MIRFTTEQIRETKKRFVDLSTSADRRNSEVTAAYNTMKSRLTEKLNAINRDIAQAEGEREEARRVLAHNKEVEQRERQRIRDAKARMEKDEQEKSKAERSLQKKEAALSSIRSMSDGKGGGAMEAMLESASSSLRSKIRDLEKSIDTQQEIITKAEKKLEAIEKANRRLEQILTAIEKTVAQLQAAAKRIRAVQAQLTQGKERFDSTYLATHKGMEVVHQKTEAALNYGISALEQFKQAGCGHCSSVDVDSSSTVSNIAMVLSQRATGLSDLILNLRSATERYRAHLKDNVSRDAERETKRIKGLCEDQKQLWEDHAQHLQNAAHQLSLYLGCKM
jgi:chromosome segregation ATPase